MESKDPYSLNGASPRIVARIIIRASHEPASPKPPVLDYSGISDGERILPTNPIIVVHGGAWAIPDDMLDAHLNGVRNAASAGWRVLERGGSALDAVEEAVVVLEDDETFDAGRGSFLNRDGKVQLDAFIMDGATLRGGGVGCVERCATQFAPPAKF